MIKSLIIINIFISIVFANQEAKIKSSIPIPETKILKKNVNNCDNICLNKFILDEQIFSFLANVPDKVNNFALKEQKLILQSIFNIKNHNESFGSLKIALLLPEKVIGRYSSSTTKAVFSYLLTKKSKFQIKSFFIDKEDNQSISKALENINKDNFKFVIAPMTLKGAKIISKLSPQTFIFFPTIHASKIKSRSKYLFFGGIDYNAQIQKLLTYQKNRRIALFYDNSVVGRKLNSTVILKLKKSLPNTRISINRAVSKKTSEFSQIFKDNNRTVGLSYFLNTTVVQSSILLAQLTSFDQEPSLILSTQINYTPTLLSMTQPSDRNKVLIANSISKINDRYITDANSLLNNDIIYDKINYSTTVGLDYFFHLITGKERIYKEVMIENQIRYSIRIMKPLRSKFAEIR